MPIAKKWTPLGISTSLSPKKWMAAPGTHGARREQAEEGDGPLTQEAAHSDPYRTPPGPS